MYRTRRSLTGVEKEAVYPLTNSLVHYPLYKFLVTSHARVYVSNMS